MTVPDSGDTSSRPPVVEYTPAHDAVDGVVDDPAVGGSYALVFEADVALSVEVGALGTVELPAGRYAYVGSAFGPGGFARAERHRRHLDGEEETVHWHVDALTTHEETSFVRALLCPGVDVECVVASKLPAGPVEGFGSSDCRCHAHLSCVDSFALDSVVRTAVEGVRSS